MLTYQETYEKAQALSGDFSAANLLTLKQDINLGMHKINAAMNRYFTRKSKNADLVADQQYYQLPPDAIRPIGVTVLIGTRRYPVKQIRSEYQWNQINTVSQTASWAQYYFVKGSDEIGLWPIPSAAVSSGLEVQYEPRDKDLSQDDVTTGTVTCTNGSVTITHSGTSFSQSMIGRVFKVTDGTDGYWYRIAGFTSSSVLSLEEPFIGLSGSGKTYKIGEAFIFPSEFHDAPVDYALYRFFELNNDPNRAQYHRNAFDSALINARQSYASSSSSSVVVAQDTMGLNPWLVAPDAVTE